MPFRPGRAMSGFRTGPLGMGHIVMNVERIDEVLPFYQDLLGFRLSDYTLRPFKAFFLHLNPRHHSFAMVETGTNSVHHLMVETVHARRCRAGLRSGARRGRPDCDDAWTAFERLHDVVLCAHALGILRRVRMGRAVDRAGDAPRRWR